MQQYLRYLCLVLLMWESSAAVACEEINISLIDQGNNKVAANSIEWWFSGNEKYKNILTCEKSVCHSWSLPIASTQSINIELVVIRNHEDDESCADWFRGSVQSPVPTSEQIVKVRFAETVCK